MGNQQPSFLIEYKRHPIYTMLEISNLGEVRNYKNKKVRYTRINKQGYRITQVTINGHVKTLKIHRLVAELFLNSPSQELVEKCSKEHWGEVLVKHLDNDKLNNNVNNLEWCDLFSNTIQAWEDGLIPSLKGELNGRSKLTEEVVHKVCKFFEEGGSPKEAVIEFGISKQQATKIRSGISWKHISNQYLIKPMRKKVQRPSVMNVTE
jgi:uncharacterized coiled-coil DUF342 family protein